MTSFDCEAKLVRIVFTKMTFQILSYTTPEERRELRRLTLENPSLEAWHVKSSSGQLKITNAGLLQKEVYLISATDDQNLDLKEAMGGLKEEIYIYENMRDLINQLAQIEGSARNSVEIPVIQQQADETLWWAMALGLVYVLLGGWLRYFDTEWRLPLFDYRGVIYRPYLQLHLPTLGGTIFFLVTLRLRHLSRSFTPLRLFFVLFSGSTLAFFTFLFFRYGFIVGIGKEIHSEGLGMLTQYEPFRLQRFLVDDTYRFYLNTGFSPNIWPFWQPWLIVLSVGGGWFLTLRWLVSMRVLRR